MDIKEQVRLQFGSNAAHYVSSPLHAAGADLQLLADWIKAENASRALDIATGGGHAALVLAQHAAEVTALDMTEPMLQVAESFLNSQGCNQIRYVQGDAEALPFEAGSFDIAVCRIAAHHFPNVDAFVKEAARVLRADGSLILFDNVSSEWDELDALYNEVEKRRDPSHYRAWRKSEWITKLELAGFKVEQLVQSRKTFYFDSWCGRMNVPETTKRELEAYMLSQPEELQRQLGIQTEQGSLLSFQGDYMLLKVRKAV